MNPIMNFGEALHLLKSGSKVTRIGWGDGIYIKVHPVTSDEECSQPYIVIFSGYGDRSGSNLPIGISPWTPNTVDILSEDWIEVN